MSMVVQHNLQAMNSNRMLGITTSAQSKSTEKLSSGYKINRAADDAAGLTISEKMRKQMRGLDRASTNAQDGVSAVQTAEGALTEVHSMLQRMNELAVQAANGTNSESDRDAIQAEIDQLSTEIDRVAETTKFNEMYLLKGDTEVDKKMETLAAHDAGLDGKLVDLGNGTSTFTPATLEDGEKVSIAGTTYTIDSAQDDDTTTPASTVKQAITAATQDANVAASDTIVITPDGGTAATYTYTDEIAGDALADVVSDVQTAQAAANDGDTLVVTDADGNATTYTYKEGTSATDAKAAIGNVAAGKDIAGTGTVTLAANDTIKITDAAGAATTYTYLAASDIKDAATAATAVSTDAGTNNTVGKTITITHTDGTTDTYTCAANGGNFLNGADNVTAATLTNGDQVTLSDGTSFYVQDNAGFYDLTTGTALDTTATPDDGTKIEINIANGGTAVTATYSVGADVWTDGTDTFSTDSLKAGDKVTIGGGDYIVERAAGFYDTDGKAIDPNQKLAGGTTVAINIAGRDADTAEYETSYTVAEAKDGNVIGKKEAVALMKSALEQASAIGADDKAAVKADFDEDAGTFTITQGTVEIPAALSFNLHVGSDADMTNKIGVKIETMNASYLGIKDLDVVGEGNDGGMAATYAIDAIADAISKVSAQRSALGAVQNRLEHTIANLDNVVENTTAAESRIRDTDMAEEMVEYSKNNILAQAGQSMLAQANQSTQGVLSLLG